MITLYGLKVRKDSIKEVRTEGGCYYALTDDFIKINLDHDEIMLVYRECPKVQNDDAYKRLFSCYDETALKLDNDGQGESVCKEGECE